MPSSLRQVLQAHLCSLAKAGEEPGPVQALERLHLHLSLESTAETWVGVGVSAQSFQEEETLPSTLLL